MTVRDLAAALQKNVGSSATYDWWGVVQGIEAGASPPTVTVHVNGGTSPVSCRYSSAYERSNPTIGDGVFGRHGNDGDMWVLDCLGNERSQSGMILAHAQSGPELPNGSVIERGPIQLQAHGGTGPYTWAITSTTPNILPAGLSLSSSGAITGTPTAAGSPTFTVQVTDHLGATDSTSLSIAVDSAYPSIQTQQDFIIPSGSSLTIVNTSLPIGVVGQYYGSGLEVASMSAVALFDAPQSGEVLVRWSALFTAGYDSASGFSGSVNAGLFESPDTLNFTQVADVREMVSGLVVSGGTAEAANITARATYEAIVAGLTRGEPYSYYPAWQASADPYYVAQLGGPILITVTAL